MFLRLRELFDQLLDLLRLTLVSDEQGVIRLHDYGVAQSNDRDGRAGFCAGVEDDVARGVHFHEVRHGAVSGSVGFEMARERGPRAEVVPCEAAVGHDHVLRFLHQSVVDGDAFRLGIFLGQNFRELALCRGVEPALAGGEHLRLMFLQSFGDGHEAPDKHSRVPAIVAVVQIFHRAIEVRFLDELLGALEQGLVTLHAVRRGQRLADADVAVAGIRFGGPDADGDDGLTARGQIEGVRENLLELFLIGDDVVGGQHSHHAGRGARPDQRRAERDRGARVAPARFSHDVFLRQLGQLFANFAGLRLVGDDEDVLERHERHDAINGVLKKRLLVEQREQLLGRLLAAHGPETFAAPAGHDDDEPVS